jgi:hypothetical protein
VLTLEKHHCIRGISRVQRQRRVLIRPPLQQDIDHRRFLIQESLLPHASFSMELGLSGDQHIETRPDRFREKPRRMLVEPLCMGHADTHKNTLPLDSFEDHLFIMWRFINLDYKPQRRSRFVGKPVISIYWRSFCISLCVQVPKQLCKYRLCSLVGRVALAFTCTSCTVQF